MFQFLGVLFLVAWFGIFAPRLARTLLGMDDPLVNWSVIALVLALIPLVALVRELLRTPAGADRRTEPVELDAYEAAVLAGGPELATNAVLASLVHRGIVSVHVSERLLSLCQNQATSMHPLEEAAYSAIGPDPGQGIESVRWAVRPAIDQIRDRLVQCGLVMSERRVELLDLMFIPVFLCNALAFWMAGYWSMSILGQLVGFIPFWLTLPLLDVEAGRTHDGDRVLGELKEQNATLGLIPTRGDLERQSEDLVLTMALFDRRLLADGPLAELWSVLEADLDGDSDEAGGADEGGCDGGWD